MIALDLEGTLISNAVSQIPRPHLRAFACFCCENFERIALFTAVPARCREILRRRVASSSVDALIIPPVLAAGGDPRALLRLAIEGLFNGLLVQGIIRAGWNEGRGVLLASGRLLLASGCGRGPGRIRTAAESAINSLGRQNTNRRPLAGILTLIIAGGVATVDRLADEYVSVNALIARAFLYAEVYRAEALLYALDGFNGLRVSQFVAVEG